MAFFFFFAKKSFRIMEGVKEMKKFFDNHRNIRKLAIRFVLHMEATYKNKLAALGLIACGAAAWFVGDDGTGSIFVWMMGFALFFTKENVIF